MLIDIVIFVIALTTLVVASDWLISSAEKIGLSWGISPFIIGVTIVAFGTSLPELMSSISAVMNDTSEFVVGNVIGSNVANILLVIGLTAVIGKGIEMDFDVMNTDMPLLLSSAFLFYWIISDATVHIWEAILFLFVLAIFLLHSIRSGGDEEIEKPKVGIREYAMVIAGVVLVWLGAEYTIQSVKSISSQLGVSATLISLTVVAIGTSLPEIVVSLQAARRGKNAIAIGNVLGSNIFNTYGVMGIPALIGDLEIPAINIEFAGVFMVMMTILFAVICLSKKISVAEGIVMLVLYVYFIGELVIRGTL